MLVYHPAFDFYHGLFRALLLLESTPEKSMASDTLRIVDLYFLFPYLLNDFSFTKGTRRTGLELAGSPSRFNTLPTPRLFLVQTRGLHTLILSALSGQRLIDGEALKQLKVKRTDLPIPDKLLNNVTAGDLTLAAYLGANIATIPLFGNSGLKARSKLMEYRYDPA
jgi:hypothetical protein